MSGINLGDKDKLMSHLVPAGINLCVIEREWSNILEVWCPYTQEKLHSMHVTNDDLFDYCKLASWFEGYIAGRSHK